MTTNTTTNALWIAPSNSMQIAPCVWEDGDLSYKTYDNTWINTTSSYNDIHINEKLEGPGPLEQFNDKLESLNYRNYQEKIFLQKHSSLCIKDRTSDFMTFILTNEFSDKIFYLIGEYEEIYLTIKNEEDKALFLLMFKD